MELGYTSNNMRGFVVKYFLIFVSFISLVFFSLIGFQSHTMKREQIMNPPVPFNGMPMPMPMPHPPQAPSLIPPFIFILILSSIFVYIVLKYIEKNFINPLITIENNVKKIKDGSLDVKFTTDVKNNTVTDTYQTLNEMVSGLKQRDKLHDNFIQNLVHDLRAPVIAQERAMEILSDEFKNNQLIAGMLQNNDAYLSMINKIIETFRQKEVKIEKIDFNLSNLVDTIIEALYPAAESKHISIKNTIKDNDTIWADYISINRIVMNLISNAIENIDVNKVITVKAEKNNKNTIITIEDNGQGIDSETKETIFEKYVSGNKSSKKSVSGLGLSIVHDLVTKNGGKIWVESEKDKYTRFIIKLPNK